MIFKEVLLWPLLLSEERAKLGGYRYISWVDDIYCARKPFKTTSSWIMHALAPRKGTSCHRMAPTYELAVRHYNILETRKPGKVIWMLSDEL